MFGAITETLIELAIKEDVGGGDLTSLSTIPAEACGAASVVAKQSLVVCGHEVAARVFQRLDADFSYRVIKPDGEEVSAGTVIAKLQGPTRVMLSGERTALNFLQRLSGVATVTARIVGLVQGQPVRILDTRKTTPGWRELEKYAVTAGGGCNHRIGLYDAVLIKDNHTDALGGDIIAAVFRCREKTPAGTKIEVEVRNDEELSLALQAKPDAILLDNMSAAQMRRAVQRVRSTPGGEKIELEASGGITESNLAECAQTGVDSISLGMLTHSAKAVDISICYDR